MGGPKRHFISLTKVMTIYHAGQCDTEGGWPWWYPFVDPTHSWPTQHTHPSPSPKGTPTPRFEGHMPYACPLGASGSHHDTQPPRFVPQTRFFVEESPVTFGCGVRGDGWTRTQHQRRGPSPLSEPRTRDSSHTLPTPVSFFIKTSLTPVLLPYDWLLFYLPLKRAPSFIYLIFNYCVFVFGWAELIIFSSSSLIFY